MGTGVRNRDDEPPGTGNVSQRPRGDGNDFMDAQSTISNDNDSTL